LDFEKTFDKINEGFLFSTLKTLGFNDYWTKWVFALYLGATLIMEVHGEMSAPFILFVSIRQSCLLSLYLFILTINVLGYVLENLWGHLTKWGHNLGPILCQLYDFIFRRF